MLNILACLTPITRPGFWPVYVGDASIVRLYRGSALKRPRSLALALIDGHREGDSAKHSSLSLILPQAHTHSRMYALSC